MYIDIINEEESTSADLVLLHGFGSHEGDLAGLLPYLPASDTLRCYFPRAPIDVPMTGGYAWFPSAAEELQKALMGQYFFNLKELDPEAMQSNARLVADTINKNRSDTNRPLILGGFSQGAILSMEIFLNGYLSVDGLLLWSGSLLAEERWKSLTAPSKVPCFISHGRQDPVLPFEGATALESLLKEKGLSVENLYFDGAHEINMPIIEASQRVITRCLED